jgi:hypothetical protein
MIDHFVVGRFVDFAVEAAGYSNTCSLFIGHFLVLRLQAEVID